MLPSDAAGAGAAGARPGSEGAAAPAPGPEPGSAPNAAVAGAIHQPAGRVHDLLGCASSKIAVGRMCQSHIYNHCRLCHYWDHFRVSAIAYFDPITFLLLLSISIQSLFYDCCPSTHLQADMQPWGVACCHPAHSHRHWLWPWATHLAPLRLWPQPNPVLVS